MDKKMFQIMGKDKKMIRSALIFILIFAVIVGIISLEYYKNLEETRFEESSSYLQEVSKQMGANTSKILEDNYAVLGTISSVLRNFGNMSSQEFQLLVNEQKLLWQFKDIMLVDEKGVIYSSEGKTLSLPNNDYLSNSVVNRQNTMANSQIIDGEECIVFAVPIENVMVNGKSYSALCASYALETFDTIITTSTFGGKAYTHIIDNSGSVVVRSTSPYAEQCGYNLFTYLNNNVSGNEAELERMNKDISKGKSGIVVCPVNGVEKYISYLPLENSDWCLMTFVPASVANEKSNILMKISAVFCTFIAILMVLLVMLLVLNFIRHSRRMEKLIFEDSITGGNTLQKFQIICESILQEVKTKKFAMVYINIEKFKVINDQFGRTTGDSILKIVNKGVEKDMQAGTECIARVMADHFCALIEYKTEEHVIERFKRWRTDIESMLQEDGIEIVLPAMCIGVYVINVPTMPVPFMVDRAKLSLSETVNNYHSKIHYALYDERKRDKLFREKQLEDRMEQALENNEFEVYLQPKYGTENKKIAGAEALIRWNDTDGKMIYPDEFIPLFERNGFIVQVDMWVLDQVCATLQKWQNAGKKMITISVNCSRLNLNRTDFVETYRSIFEKYSFPAHYIEIELTESVVYEDTQRLLKVIDELHSIGFTCSIDDFGSGYSSLNMIQDIPVDVLKLDKIFFRNTKGNNERARSVIGGIITMAQALNMKTVAEGVEVEDQVEMLSSLGCSMIQGYVFAKPMPIQTFEQLPRE